MVHIWHWILDFVGVNNGFNTFSTKMYNFWSGFGGGIIQFSLLGALVAIYKHYIEHNKVVEIVGKRIVKPIQEEIEKPIHKK